MLKRKIVLHAKGGFFLFLEVNECAKYYFYRLGNFKLRWACLGNFGQLFLVSRKDSEILFAAIWKELQFQGFWLR